MKVEDTFSRLDPKVLACFYYCWMCCFQYKLIDYVIDVNIKGTANVLRHFIPLMIPKNQGVIVNISSIYGKTGAALVRIDLNYCKFFITIHIYIRFVV